MEVGDEFGEQVEPESQKKLAQADEEGISVIEIGEDTKGKKKDKKKDKKKKKSKDGSKSKSSSSSSSPS